MDKPERREDTLIKIWKYYTGLQELAFSEEEPPMRVQYFDKGTSIDVSVQQGYFIKKEQLKSIMMKCSYDGLDERAITDLLKDLGVE